MPYSKNVGSYSEINWLASARYQNFTTVVSDSGVTADANGRKVVKSGTILPLNDTTAAGILFNDVDVTEGPQPGSLMVEGYVHEARLPVAPVAAAKTALKEIKFR